MSDLSKIKILHIDSNHPLLWEQLEKAGFSNEADFTSTKEEVENKIENWWEKEEKTLDELLANVPMGLELTAGISTNYLCLKNMFHQRKNHKLKFWTETFVPWVKSLPMAKELITGES